jgi:alkaline phosphatase D
VLWTRVTTGPSGAGDEPVEVSWTVGRDPEVTDVVAAGTATAAPEGDHTVHVDVPGLEPATTYHYRFSALDDLSPVGRTRTLPGPGAQHLRFAMASCARFDVGFFNAYARIAERDDLDFFLHLGDYIYEGSNKRFPNDPVPDLGRVFDPDDDCVTLDDYRRRHAEYCGDPDVQTVRAAHPMIATVDDHDFADGCWHGGSSWHQPEDGPWSDRRAAAFRARWEWLPARLPDPADPERVFRTVHIGGLADLFITDIRTRRDEPVPPPAMLGDDRTILGSEQRAWLLGELDASTATWRLLANSSVMGQTWAEHLPESVRPSLAMLKLLGSEGTGPDPDQWDGYPAERVRLMQHVRDEGIDNLVVLSGDVHVAIALELHVDAFDGNDPVAVEFVTASLTSANLDEKMGWPRRTSSLEIERGVVDALGHWKWCDFDDHGYVVIDVVPDRLVAEWRFVPTVLERVGGEEAGARWMVEHGRPRIVAAQ